VLRGRRTGAMVASASISAVLGTLVPAAASAHSISGKLESPLPFVAYIAGAAVAVAASFIIVAVRDPGPPLDRAPLATHEVPRLLRSTLRAVGLIGWLWIVLQAIAGGSSDADVASLFLWTFGWVALAMTSALLGPVWSWLDPFSTLHHLGSRALRLLRVQGIAPQPYPERLGRWPAIIGFCFIVWLELVAKVVHGRLLGVVLMGYTLVQLLGTAFRFPTVPVGTLLLAGFLGGLVLLVLLVARSVGSAAIGAGLVPVAVGYLVAHYLGSLPSTPRWLDRDPAANRCIS
jgi:hypothetical protein